MKQDKAPSAIDISRLGANAVMARAEMIAQTIQQLGRWDAPGTADAVGTGRSEDDVIRKILGLPKDHHLGTISTYQWIHFVLADQLG